MLHHGPDAQPLRSIPYDIMHTAKHHSEVTVSCRAFERERERKGHPFRVRTDHQLFRPH
jgi:hypothetical protein